MQEDFHYYATYCAAYLAGYSHEEAMDICYSAQFVDLCSKSFLSKVGGPGEAATTQLQLEMMDEKADVFSIQEITRIWSSFHFLPKDLYAKKKWCSRMYKNKYRLICGPNGELVKDTVRLAKGQPLQAVGIAMHVLADTWAHMYFAGTPSLVINNTNHHFYEILTENGETTERHIVFKHNPAGPDDVINGSYTGTLLQGRENSIMSLGHGRAGHLPDYSFMRYRYLPAWAGYREVYKDNPSDYRKAFCQMIYAMKFIRGDIPRFKLDTYDFEAIADYEDEIRQILEKRQLNACAEWKTFGEKLSGKEIEDFDLEKHIEQYTLSPAEIKERTYLGRFFHCAMMQKSMVTNKIYTSGNMLAGFSIDYRKKGFGGMKDYLELVTGDISGRKRYDRNKKN